MRASDIAIEIAEYASSVFASTVISLSMIRIDPRRRAAAVADLERPERRSQRDRRRACRRVASGIATVAAAHL